jgi:hypothetical protein
MQKHGNNSGKVPVLEKILWHNLLTVIRMSQGFQYFLSVPVPKNHNMTKIWKKDNDHFLYAGCLIDARWFYDNVFIPSLIISHP